MNEQYNKHVLMNVMNESEKLGRLIMMITASDYNTVSAPVDHIDHTIGNSIHFIAQQTEMNEQKIKINYSNFPYVVRVAHSFRCSTSIFVLVFNFICFGFSSRTHTHTSSTIARRKSHPYSSVLDLGARHYFGTCRSCTCTCLWELEHLLIVVQT